MTTGFGSFRPRDAPADDSPSRSRWTSTALRTERSSSARNDSSALYIPLPLASTPLFRPTPASTDFTSFSALASVLGDGFRPCVLQRSNGRLSPEFTPSHKVGRRCGAIMFLDLDTRRALPSPRRIPLASRATRRCLLHLLTNRPSAAALPPRRRRPPSKARKAVSKNGHVSLSGSAWSEVRSDGEGEKAIHPFPSFPSLLSHQLSSSSRRDALPLGSQGLHTRMHHRCVRVLLGGAFDFPSERFGASRWQDQAAGHDYQHVSPLLLL